MTQTQLDQEQVRGLKEFIDTLSLRLRALEILAKKKYTDEDIREAETQARRDLGC
jgi:hypothetical protein